MTRNNYGEMIARKRAKAKREAEALKIEKEQEKAVRKKTAKKKSPTIERNPLSLKKVQLPSFKYNWNDSLTVEHSDYLAKELSGSAQMKMLVLPPGVGKTAISVRTLGELQKLREDGTKLPFVVIASRAIVDGRGWHNTILAWNHDNPDNTLEPIAIDTYDRLSAYLDDKKGMQQLFIELINKGIMVIDEVQNYKNPTSKRSKKLQKLSDIKKLTLSATPLTNDVVMDGGSYMIMADMFPNKTQFMRMTGLDERIGRFGELLIRNKKGYVTESLWPFYPKFLEYLSQIIYYPEVDLQNLDMPDVESKMINLPFDDLLNEDMKSLARAYQKRMFDSSTDYRLAMIERICSDRVRLDRMLEIVNDSSTVQPLIFYTNNSVKDAVIKEFEEKGIEYQIVSGGNSFAEVDLNKDCPILVQYQSGSEGIEMKMSNTSIFYQNQTSYRTLEQSRGRNRRRGMKHSVKHYYLVASNAFDIELFTRVNNYEEISNHTLDEITERTLDILKS